MMFTQKPRSVVASVVVLCALLLILVVLSPFVLARASDVKLDWSRLSDVGQAYGGVTAVLSALAFCAIAASLLLQWQQTRIVSIAAARERHFELVRMTVDHPELMPMSLRRPFAEESRQVVYANLWVSHWQMLWELGMLADERVVRIATDMFLDPVLRRWWELYRESWTDTGTRAGRHFLRLVSSGYDIARNAADDPPTVGTTADGSPSKARTAAYLGTGAAMIAALVVVRQLRRGGRRPPQAGCR